MDIKNCMECGRPVPPDEAQLVADRVSVIMRPVLERIGGNPESFGYGMFGVDRICAQCFNERNEQYPLSEWVEELLGDPDTHPAMYQWQLIRKGPDHVD